MSHRSVNAASFFIGIAIVAALSLFGACTPDSGIDSALSAAKRAAGDAKRAVVGPEIDKRGFWSQRPGSGPRWIEYPRSRFFDVGEGSCTRPEWAGEDWPCHCDDDGIVYCEQPVGAEFHRPEPVIDDEGCRLCTVLIEGPPIWSFDCDGDDGQMDAMTRYPSACKVCEEDGVEVSRCDCIEGEFCPWS